MSKKLNKKRLTKTLQFFAAYLVAAWTLLQFVDWILTRYSISPYWVDFLLWVFIGIIPSLIIYLYNQERINNRVLKIREKIIFPLNVLLIMVVTYFWFGNSDLGATIKNINYTNEQGQQQTAVITKEEFRKGFYIFNFEPKTADSTKAWLEFGITRLLHEDLLQNKNLNPLASGWKNTPDKVRESSYIHEIYVDGEFEIIDSTYTITAFIRKSTNANIIKQETLTGTDVLSLIDDITVFVTNNSTPNEFNTPQYLDLDVKDFTSSSLKAIEYYMAGDFENATKEDNTFALAYLNATKRTINFNNSKFEERVLADKAYENRLKLPLQKQLETLIYRNLAYDAFDNAEELVKLQLEVDPGDQNYNRVLQIIYGNTKNVSDYTSIAYKAFENEINPTNVHNALNAHVIDEDYDRILNDINTEVRLNPNDNVIFSYSLYPQLHKGDIEAAEKTQEKIKLLHPDWENITKVYDKAIAYLKTHKITKADLQKFEGEYRHDNSESTLNIWVENNTLLQFASNQAIMPLLVAGDNHTVSGMYTHGSQTWEKEFLKTEGSNSYYAIKSEQNNGNNSFFYWNWKVDDTIKKAEALLEAKKLDSAKIAYEKAINANPKHFYLKNQLKHVQYMASNDSLKLQEQYKALAGTYGPRRFWSEDGKFYYKREGITKKELLAISENRFINLTDYTAIMSFEPSKNGTMTSLYYKYNREEDTWDKVDDENNYFIRND